MDVDRMKIYAPSSKVYAPTRGTSAYAYPLPAYEPERRQEQQPTRREQRRTAPAPRSSEKPRLSIGGKVTIVFSIGLLAVTMLLVIARYADISAQHLQINEIKQNIESTRLRLAELNVALQCTVSIHDAQDAAARLGMTYPEAAQYIRAGDALPRIVQQSDGGAAPSE